MKKSQPSGPIDTEKLKALLHEKIEHMNGSQLSMLNRVLFQVEAEELAERLGESFDKDLEGKGSRRIAQLVKQIRAEHRPA